MHSADSRLARAYMEARLDDARNPIGANELRRVKPARQGWLTRRGCWVLCQLGHLLVEMGEWLQRRGEARPLSARG